MLRKFDGGCSNLTWEVLTGDETWMYWYDPKTKMQSAAWLFPNESPLPKLKRYRSAQKESVAGFLRKAGHVATIPVEDGRTVTADWCVHHCLPNVLEVLYQRHPKTRLRGFFLRRVNASGHTAVTMVGFLRIHRIHQTSLPDTSSYL